MLLWQIQNKIEKQSYGLSEEKGAILLDLDGNTEQFSVVFWSHTFFKKVVGQHGLPI